MKRLVLIIAAIAAACSQQSPPPEILVAAPDTPRAAGEMQPPNAPDSATNIMRIQDIDFASYDRGIAAWVKLEIGESMSSATAKIETHFSPRGGTLEDAYDAMAPKKTETEFSTFGGEGGKVTLVERVNIRDDSVKAEQFYAIFKAKNDGYVLVDYGLKIKCHRGENTEIWQTEPCP